MIANRTQHLMFLFLLAIAGASRAQSAEPPVAVKTDGLPLHVAARVEQKAAQGITELRRYVWISRAVNQLDLRSLIREQEPEQVARAEDDEPPATVAALNEQR